MRVGLGEQGFALGLEGRHGVGAGGEAGRGLLKSNELHEGVGELGRVASLLAIHAAPRGDGFHGALGVIVDGGFGVGRGVRKLDLPRAHIDAVLATRLSHVALGASAMVGRACALDSSLYSEH